jgi:leucine dehydrogenase
MLHEAGARLVVAEPRSEVAARAAVRFDAEIMTSDALINANIDVFAPCALGAVLNERAVGRLRAKVVCGAANNQCASPQQGLDLARRGILYAPDYLVNAGGIINVAGEFLGWSAAEVQARVQRIGPRLSEVLNEAEAEGIAPHEAADTLARAIIARDARVEAPSV